MLMLMLVAGVVYGMLIGRLGGGMFGAVESGRLGRVLVQEFGVGYRAAEDEGSGYLAGIIRDYWRR